MTIIASIRLGFHLAILAIIIGFQALQPAFVNYDVIVPVYTLLGIAFLVSSVYLYFFKSVLHRWPVTAFLFFFEATFITGLIHFTGVNQSIFLFLYLVNIILCGFVFQRRGAYVLAFWTSALFSVLMIVGPELKGQALFFAVALNNIAFFTVATLAGILSEQLDFMGRSLEARGRDLRALQELQTLIVDNMATGLMTIDGEGICVQANNAAFQILDPIPPSLVGRSVDSILPGALGKIQDRSEKTVRFDLEYFSPMQGKQTLEFIVSDLPERQVSDRVVRGSILTFTDLTRVRRLEYAVRQSEKMAAVGQLAAGIAHEIRNPLASMSGSIQLLESSLKRDQDEERRLMKIVLREIDRLNNLITEFLDFVRPDIISTDPVDLNSLVRELIEMLSMNPNLKKNVQQIVELGEIEPIHGNRDKLKQALLNILINGYQAMSDSPEPRLTIRTFSRSGSTLISISDNGCGMDEIGIRRMFEPFHTTKPKGTGLGLAITHKIIQTHNGEIFVQSQKGKGTEFVIEFKRDSTQESQNTVADSQRASEDFQKAFRGQKRTSPG